MPIDRNNLTVREQRILLTALTLHQDTLGEMTTDGQYAAEHKAALAHDIITTNELIKDIKRRRRR
jgi:hypothetical protein